MGLAYFPTCFYGNGPYTDGKRIHVSESSFNIKNYLVANYFTLPSQTALLKDTIILDVTCKERVMYFSQ